MNTAVSTLEGSKATIFQRAKSAAKDTQTKPLAEQYLSDSQIFYLKGGFTAEVIQEPGKKFRETNQVELVIAELGPVLLAAFEKSEQDSELFLSGDRFTRVAVDVDWLIVVRKNGHPVAFSSVSYITPFMLYMNAAMVLPKMQVTGIGLVASTLLLKLAIEDAKDRYILEPDLVCRTHNRSVGSITLHIWKNATISSELTIDENAAKIFQQTVEHLKCNFDKNTGISYNVYPMELPEGGKTNNQRINQAFEKIGARDGCYITGKLNMEHVEKVLARFLHKEETKAVYDFSMIPVYA